MHSLSGFDLVISRRLKITEVAGNSMNFSIL